MPDGLPGTNFGYVTPENLPLFTDLYELTMTQAAVRQGHNPTATFDLFFRDLPTNRGYVIAAGLEQAVHYIDGLTFGDRALDYLAAEGFDDDFLDYLASFSFAGEVRALPEGTAVFPNEPLIEVTAPLAQAQLFETLLINQVGFGSLIATKAARMRDVVERHGDGQVLVDFGSRRGHGTDAGMKAARAAYAGGFDGTSNVAAGEAFGIPIYGTMAHSWVQSFPTEREAFATFVDEYGDESVLLIDTYDTVAGAKTAVAVADEKGVGIRGVRLDSGDLAELSKRVAGVVDDDTRIFVSSGMQEYAIRRFFEDGGVADGFGPGTALVTSTDAPTVEGVYKLVAVEYDGDLRPSTKLSPGKVTYPGRKTVRRVERDGVFERDVVGLRDESLDGEEQLVTVFEDGDLVYDLPDLAAIRERTRRTLRKLPEAVRRVEEPEPYEAAVSDGLASEAADLEERLAERMGLA